MKWNENSIERARRTTRVRTYIKWSTHRYYNSFIFQGLSFRISPANTPLLYSLAITALRSRLFRGLQGSLTLKENTSKVKQFFLIFWKEQFLFLSNAWLHIIFGFAKKRRENRKVLKKVIWLIDSLKEQSCWSIDRAIFCWKNKKKKLEFFKYKIWKLHIIIFFLRQR